MRGRPKSRAELFRFTCDLQQQQIVIVGVNVKHAQMITLTRDFRKRSILPEERCLEDVEGLVSLINTYEKVLQFYFPW